MNLSSIYITLNIFYFACKTRGGTIYIYIGAKSVKQQRKFCRNKEISIILYSCNDNCEAINYYNANTVAINSINYCLKKKNSINYFHILLQRNQ